MKIVYIKNVATGGSNHMKTDFGTLPSELQQALSKQHIYMDNNTLYISSQMSKCDLLFYITKFNLLDYTEVTDTGMLTYAKKYDKVHTIQDKNYISTAIVYEYCSIHKPLLVGRLLDGGKYVGAIALVREPNNYHLKPVMFSDELKGFINGFINGNEIYISGVADCNIPIYDKEFRQLNNSAMIVGYNDKSYYLLYNGKVFTLPIDSIYHSRNNIPIIANISVINGNISETGVGRTTMTSLDMIDKPNFGKDDFKEVIYAIDRARKGKYNYHCSYMGIDLCYDYKHDSTTSE